ncbi:MAG: nucleotide kinase domain-containing protein [Dolichospermum sp.]
MQVRQEIFDTYWRFAAMRQEVFFNKLKNVRPPWTSDPILNTYKFCNAYRVSDRVSQYLIKNVIYDENRSQNEEEVLFRILLFKIFNKIETWEYLESKIGDYITLSNFDLEGYSNILQEAMNIGYVIYTSAYMSCASKEFGYDKKHQNHLALIDKMVVKDRVINRIVKAKSLEEIFHILESYPLLGKFMAYQLATDINYSEVINFDDNSFTIAGPGAERGINKCFIDTKGKSYADIIYWMTENQENQFQRLGLNFKSLWGRPLKAIDCQNLFCETDKYCRAAFPDLKSNRKKIKAKFTATPQPIDYFYPPKWCINDQVQETLAQRLPPLEIPNLQDNSQQLSLELDSLVKTTSEIPNCISKQHNKNGQKTPIKKSSLFQNPDTEKSQQLCLF